MEYDRQTKSFIDPILGRITVSRNRGRYLKLNVKTTGEIVVTVPYGTPIATIRAFIEKSRPDLAPAINRVAERHSYHNGDQIGQHHQLLIKSGARAGTRITDRTTEVTIPDTMNHAEMVQYIHSAVSKTLRREAGRYLPKRLIYYAAQFGYRYGKVRLTFAKSRWGSCSSNGTISLNVALMTLPTELSDYVILHELAHTKQMNHGPEFWRQLESTLPNAKALNDQLKDYSPYI